MRLGRGHVLLVLGPLLLSLPTPVPSLGKPMSELRDFYDSDSPRDVKFATVSGPVQQLTVT